MQLCCMYSGQNKFMALDYPTTTPNWCWNSQKFPIVCKSFTYSLVPLLDLASGVTNIHLASAAN